MRECRNMTHQSDKPNSIYLIEHPWFAKNYSLYSKVTNPSSSQSWFRRKFLTYLVFISFKALLGSFFPPTKFVPWSHLSSWTLPLRLMNRLSALIKASLSMEFNVSKCIAREQRQMKICPQYFNTFRPSLMYQGVRNLPIASNTRDFLDNIHVKSTNRLESLHYIFNVPAQRKITIARSHVNSHMVLKP